MKSYNTRNMIQFTLISIIAGLLLVVLAYFTADSRKGDKNKYLPPLTLLSIDRLLSYVDASRDLLLVKSLKEEQGQAIHEHSSIHKPAWSPNGKYIAYSISKNDGSYTVIVKDLSSRKAREIFYSRQFCLVLSWQSQNELYLVEFNAGRYVTKLFYLDSKKTKVIYAKFNKEYINRLIAGIKLDGFKNSLVINDDDMKSIVVIPSKNNQREVYFFYDRGYYPILISNLKTGRIEIVPIVGSPNNPPAWFYDGSKIAFSSDRDHSIYIYDIDQRIVSEVASDRMLNFFNPNWSRDGQYLVFESMTKEADIPREKGIFLYELSSKKIFRITEKGKEPAIY